MPSQYLKDKDEDAGPRQPQRKPKPKSDEPAPEIKKSRANFAERNAFDKKRNDDRREGGKNQNDKRKNNNNSGRDGRVNEDGEYDEYTYRKKKSSLPRARRQRMLPSRDSHLPSYPCPVLPQEERR